MPPRAFTDMEKKRIRAALIEAGRSCFQRYGMRKTTIDDLVHLAGISKGSFYQFFKNKEDLYMEMFLQEMPAMMHRLRENSFGATDDVREALVLLMKGIAHEIETNPLARIVLDDPTQMEQFLSTLEYETIMQQLRIAYAPMLEFIRKGQEAGEIIDGDPYFLVSNLGLIKTLPIYKETIGAEMYEIMMDLAPQVIADGLTCPARAKKLQASLKKSSS